MAKKQLILHITDNHDFNAKSLKKEEQGYNNDVISHNRIQCVVATMEGCTVRDISMCLGMDPKTIIKNVKNFNEGGIEQLLAYGKSTGRPPKLTEQLEEHVYEDTMMFNEPRDVLNDCTNKSWDSKLLQTYIFETTGVNLSRSSITRRLHKLGFSYTRPTYSLAKAIPEDQLDFEWYIHQLTAMQQITLRKPCEYVSDNPILQEYYKALESTYGTAKDIYGLPIAIGFGDESHVRSYMALQEAWSKTGEQTRIPTYGKHEYVGLFGMLEYNSGNVHCKVTEKLDAVSFIDFLNELLVNYDGRHLCLILDNARIHHAILLREFLAEHDLKGKLTILYLPPYSPQLNRIEGLWKWLKSSVINNVFHPSVKSVLKEVTIFLKWCTTHRDEVKSRLCFPKAHILHSNNLTI
jgi:transposase